MTESQGDEIVSLLGKILAELEKISADVRFEIKGAATAANYNLVAVQQAVREIGKLK
jgi:hypothetical protein